MCFYDILIIVIIIILHNIYIFKLNNITNQRIHFSYNCFFFVKRFTHMLVHVPLDSCTKPKVLNSSPKCNPPRPNTSLYKMGPNEYSGHRHMPLSPPLIFLFDSSVHLRLVGDSFQIFNFISKTIINGCPKEPSEEKTLFLQ